MEQPIIDQLLALAAVYGLPVGVAFALGLFGKPAIRLLRPLVLRTPTKADDMLLSALEACLNASGGSVSKITVAELNKCLTTKQIAELVSLRKAQISADKVAAPTG